MYRRSVCQDITLILITMASSRSTVFAQSFVVSPVSAIAYLENEANFSCTTDGSHVLVWTVNGIEARLPEVRNKGIMFAHFGINSEISNLTALASIQNNNSEIICVHVNLLTGEEIARTTPAYLYVQGLLEAPPNFTVGFRNQTAIHLTWLPPFSLKDIVNYTVIVSSSDSGRGEILEARNIAVTLQSLTYTWTPSFGYCAMYIFQIAALNRLGEGNRTRQIKTSFLQPLIDISPRNQTKKLGEWTNFSCGVQCSSSEYITWFVFVNGSTLPLSEGIVNGLKIQSHPGTSLCSTSSSLKKETHAVTVMLNYELDQPLALYCALISVCGKNNPDCKTYSCYSENAYLNIEGKLIQSTQPSQFTDTESDREIVSTGFRSDENSVLKQSYSILFGTSLGLGAVLMLTLLALIICIIVCVLHRQKSNSKRQHFQDREEKEVVYDIIAPPVTVQPSMTLHDNFGVMMSSRPFDGPSATAPHPTELQHCPAYQTSDCLRRS